MLTIQLIHAAECGFFLNHLSYRALINSSLPLKPTSVNLSQDSSTPEAVRLCRSDKFNCYWASSVGVRSLIRMLTKWSEMECSLSITFKHTCEQAMHTCHSAAAADKKHVPTCLFGRLWARTHPHLWTLLIKFKQGLWKMLCYNGLMHLMHIYFSVILQYRIIWGFNTIFQIFITQCFGMMKTVLAKPNYILVILRPR